MQSIDDSLCCSSSSSAWSSETDSVGGPPSSWRSGTSHELPQLQHFSGVSPGPTPPHCFRSGGSDLSVSQCRKLVVGLLTSNCPCGLSVLDGYRRSAAAAIASTCPSRTDTFRSRTSTCHLSSYLLTTFCAVSPGRTISD